MTTSVEETRARIIQVFQYLKELHQHRNPPARRIDDWQLRLDGLPDHSSVLLSLEPTDGADETGVDQGLILRVRRPRLTKAPAPPARHREWVERGWEDPAKSVRLRPSASREGKDGETYLEEIGDDAERMRELRDWQQVRDKWAVAEMPARQAQALFEQLYEIWGRVEREAERIELVLGDGMLRWIRQDGEVEYPLIFQRAELRFDAHIPEFSIVETDTPSEFNATLIGAFEDIDPGIAGKLRTEFDDGALHPLGSGTNGFLRSAVSRMSPNGRFVEGVPPRPNDEAPTIGRNPVVFIRPRGAAFALMVDRIIEDCQEKDEFPASLTKVVGLHTAGITPAPTEQSETAWAESEAEDVLLSREANKEQLAIARRIDRENAVLVQGPPGTGKSHTIANLIGHFLAQGKTVLVTSHTTKALRVLRDHVVHALRDLCVSVLESDAEGQKQLRAAVETIVEGLSRYDKEALGAEAEAADSHRQEILEKLERVRSQLLQLRRAEYDPIGIAGDSIAPSEAARRVRREADQHSWLPGPLEPGAPLPLSIDECRDLYRTNSTLTASDEEELDCGLRELNELPGTEEFADMVARLNVALNQAGSGDLWKVELSENGAEELQELQENAAEAVNFLGNDADWTYAVVQAGTDGQEFTEVWTDLTAEIGSCREAAAILAPKRARHDVELPADHDLDELRDVLVELRDKARKKAPGKLLLMLKPRWRKAVDGSRIDSKAPSSLPHFQLLLDCCQLEMRRNRLKARWDRQMVPLGGVESAELGTEPERGAGQYVAQIEELLNWRANRLQPVVEGLKRRGLDWDLVVTREKQIFGEYGELKRLVNAIRGRLHDEVASRIAAIWAERAQRSLDILKAYLGGCNTHSVESLSKAVSDQDPVAYGLSLKELQRLEGLKPILKERRELLARLRVVAPEWGRLINERIPPHDGASLPGEPDGAWLWRQLSDEVERRSSADQTVLEDEHRALETALREATSEMIRTFAWYGQLDRTDNQARQALVGWADVIRKIGKGTGRRAPRLRKVARELMEQARKAVPVWVMPMSRLVDSFDPRSEKFDVVIIDEASQSDVLGLVAWYLGKQVLVVGDHEQVSPSAVGQRLDVVQSLINSHLTGIPNKELYDGQMSIYDLARQSFADTVRLVEHFRCVPNIIGFSNDLVYRHEIRPLREAASSTLLPHTTTFYVPNASSSKKVNEREAEVTAALLMAACGEPEYNGKTMGVVCLVGDDQARLIGDYLLRYLDPEDYESRRIICGSPAQFQGDERDVMFLSVVDGPQDGPLPLRQQTNFLQRFNVAASRAKDQMWVIHSVDPSVDLKPGDLRRRLIEYARDPNAIKHVVERAAARSESKFEKNVIADLIAAGFRVQSQVEAGYYRIDIVVEDHAGRVAVECDGDRYHPAEKLPEDMARQAVLERLKWRFIRIRGTAYFRDPVATMERVVRQLEEYRIQRIGQEEPPDESESSGLRERVIKRAFEIMRSWHPEANQLEMA